MLHDKYMCVLLRLFVSESAKGSDSEDDFIRQKTKKKPASDSDSDSDVGAKKGKKPLDWKHIWNVTILWEMGFAEFLYKFVSLNWYFRKMT